MIKRLLALLFGVLTLIFSTSALNLSLLAKDGGQPTPGEVLKAIHAEDWKSVRRLLFLGAKIPPGLSSTIMKRLELESLSLKLLSASDGDTAKVVRLLKQGADPNVAVELDDTLSALGRAARRNRVEIIRTLIAGGARVDEPIGYSMGHGWTDGSTALIWACRNNAVEAVRELLKGNANPNAQETYHPDEGDAQIKGSLPITSCENSEILKMLLQAGANPNLCGSDGFTALMKAAARGSKDDVELLLRSGASPDLKNRSGKSAEDIAKKLGKQEVLGILQSRKLKEQ